MRALSLICCFSLAAIAGCGSGSNTAHPAPGPQGWQIAAGGSAQAEAVQALDFYPNSITIDEGDTVTWRDSTAEPHTVSIPPPGQMPPAGPPQAPVGGATFDGSAYVSSGFMQPGVAYSVKFTKAGTYTYYCLIHQPEMAGTIVVQAAGSALPKSQVEYSAAAQADLTVDISAGAASVSTFPFTNGGLHLAAGISPGLASGSPSQSTVMRFLDSTSLNNQPVNVTVHVGDSVAWTNESNNSPHTVTFPVAGQTPPPGPPDGPPAGTSTYDGSTLTSSGVMPPGSSYTLQFIKAGTYTYYCLFHSGEGMTGTVTVQ